ncbi:hypothetical protein ACFV3F_29290 [Streptomyces sp. NPDC059717]|uniref:hypothetical protein n=1 Tax=Streptomyces sp. NPDC059717 TaxID=3346922 RepID=UPI00367741EF
MPEFQGRVSPAMTASRSRSMPAARVWRLGRSFVLPDGVEPVRQAFALALGEHDREGADMPGEGVEFGTVSADGLELELFGLGEGFGAAEDPAGDCPGRGWLGGHRPRRGGLLVQIGADALVAAFVSERHDLLPQFPGVGEALVPTVVEVLRLADRALQGWVNFVPA